jgi:hypothetical protein
MHKSWAGLAMLNVFVDFWMLLDNCLHRRLDSFEFEMATVEGKGRHMERVSFDL